MNPPPNDTADMNKVFTDWMRSGFDFWEKLLTVQTPASQEKTAGLFNIPESLFLNQKQADDTQKNLASGLKTFKLLASLLTNPEHNMAAFKSLNGLPDMLLETIQQGMSEALTLQSKWVETFSRVGKSSQAYNYDDLNQEFFVALRQFYETEVKKYLNIPPLGLTRFYQERSNRFFDQYNLFQTTLSEFLYVFYVPMEKSLKVMRDKFSELAEKGEIHDNFKEYYNMWIKTLEGHYMTLLKSPEYTRVMDSLIEALVQYRKAREEFLTDLLADIPVPTYKEMDELYKELYVYKKTVRQLIARLERLEQGQQQAVAV